MTNIQHKKILRMTKIEPMVNHRETLERLVHNLKDIGECIAGVHYIIKEGIWIPEPGYHFSTFPDIILVYHPNRKFRNGYGVPIELKTGNHPQFDRHLAVSQLRAGADFISHVLDKPVPRGKFVFLDYNNLFKYEQIDRSELVK